MIMMPYGWTPAVAAGHRNADLWHPTGRRDEGSLKPGGRPAGQTGPGQTVTQRTVRDNERAFFAPNEPWFHGPCIAQDRHERLLSISMMRSSAFACFR
jgi:hypothetical protein